MSTPSMMYTLYDGPVDLKNLEGFKPSVKNIAHALSLQNRWHGNTEQPWSVAHHSMHALEILEHTTPELLKSLFDIEEANAFLCLATLLHDAGEAYTGDINTYVKHSIAELNEMCNKVQLRVEEALLPCPVDPKTASIIHSIDQLCGWAECQVLASKQCPFYASVEFWAPEELKSIALDKLEEVRSGYSLTKLREAFAVRVLGYREHLHPVPETLS